MISLLFISSEGSNGSLVQMIKSCLLLKMLVCHLLENYHNINFDNEYVQCTPCTTLHGGLAPPSQRQESS